jgi:hypothetical protein
VSGFAPDWLRLREGADHRSRDPALLARLALYFGGRAEVRVVDLGAGLGSNLRASYSALPARQHWVLVDNDPLLLSAACEAIAAWADTARPTASGIEASKNGRFFHVEVKRHDLAADPVAWGADKPDLVTAAALIDLVSEAWLGRLAAALGRTRMPFYTVLTHDAVTDWQPPHPADATMRAAFERHFTRDKGFGPSAGGRATSLLAEQLMREGYEVLRAPSPWRLGRGDRELIAALAQGWAEAVRETGAVPEPSIANWLAARSVAGVECSVGHEDLLALPPD